MSDFHPILTTEQARQHEEQLLQTPEEVWEAMERAGRTLGQRVFRDFNEISPLPPNPRILVLLSKGHNSGDACLAADELLAMLPDAEVFIHSLVEELEMKPLTRQAYDLIADRVRIAESLSEQDFEICLDGIYGSQFRPPLEEDARKLLREVNNHPGILFRVAVDLPSGLGDRDAFQADFTYSTGIFKTPLLDPAHMEKVGRLRYLDLGFFDEIGDVVEGAGILAESILDPLRALRFSRVDKRSYGHLFLVAGSRTMPGALLMAAQSAATAGLGLLTVFGPESMVPHLVSALPEAMWVGLPETPDGGLALEGRMEILARMERADAVAIGPGMGRHPETIALVRELVKSVDRPILLDADALQPDIIAAAAGRPAHYGQVVITPHGGEFQRLAGEDTDLLSYAQKTGLVVAFKGPPSCITDGRRIIFSPFGGPILSRGGSGDLLSGIVGARLAALPHDAFRATCEGVAWHGRAADEWARARGAVGVRTTGLLQYLPEGLLHE